MSYKIAAPPYVGTLYLTQGNNFWWKEIYWIKGADVPAALTNISTLAGLRASIMCPDNTIVAATISDATKFRDIYQVLSPSSWLGTFGGLGAESIPAPNCTLLRIGNGQGKIDPRPLRAIPKNAVLWPSQIDPLFTSWLTAIATYCASLSTTCQLVVRTPGPPPVYTASDITVAGISAAIHNRKTSTRPFSPFRGRAA